MAAWILSQPLWLLMLEVGILDATVFALVMWADYADRKGEQR